ncbi:hypothetical protein PG984_010743 [Apiospora sp. TS-2023a]
MCQQVYLTFSSCQCELQYHHEPCAHGPASPSCRGRHTVLIPARNSICYQHAFIQNQQKRARERDQKYQEKKRQQQEQQKHDSGGFTHRVGGTSLSLFTVGSDAWKREMQVVLASAGRCECWWNG